MKRKLVAILSVLFISVCTTACGAIGSKMNDVVGSIKGNTYECQFYSNDGNKFMTVEGEKIDLASNVVKERTFNGNSWGYAETLSSVVTITIDGSQIENCGSTVLFAEKGLTPDADFQQADVENINSSASGMKDNIIIANVVNKYKNAFGKPTVVVIQSQLGDPICAYSGNNVYWEVCEDLPKTTKLMIDNKALYIHRANFQIIDKDLL